MKLYGSETSPYVRKARVLIHEKALDCQFVVLDAWAADSKVPAMNPLGKVPVLERTDGSVLYDSPVIVEYLDTLKSPTRLPAAGEAASAPSLARSPRLIPDGEARWIALRWQALADGVLDATVARLLESRRESAQQSMKDIRRQEEKVACALDWMERQVGDRRWLMGDTFSLADLVVGVALDYVDFRYPHEWRARCPALARWQAVIRARPSFVATRAPGMT